MRIMEKINIIETFNTSFGVIINVANDRPYKVNDTIEIDNDKYCISKILMPTNRISNNVGLVVNKLN